MRISFLLAALLIWDLATTGDGESTLERGGHALMEFGPVRDLVGYVGDGRMAEDVKDLTSALSGQAAVALAAAATSLSGQQNGEIRVADNSPAAKGSVTGKSADTQTAAGALVEKARADRREARERRRAQFRLAPEDVHAIAGAVAELYREDALKAENSAPDAGAAPPNRAPAREVVEKSAAALGPDLLGAIMTASKETGANSGYLLHIALRESGLVMSAQAPTSSATGPFQFIQQTWYQMLGTYGAKHGFGAEVARLEKQGNSYKPISSDARIEVLSLRTDPVIAATLAGELTMENAATLTRLLGRSPAHGELYAAHVFGPAGAARLVKTRDNMAATSAASILPSAASANRWLFYTAAGTPRSVAALFDELSRFMSTTEVATVCGANLNFFGT
ncbi:MAG: hypothetical protein K9G30_03965 [Parvibaculum sp.]|nr:hypothetical protein [Parvibaculum sp.]